MAGGAITGWGTALPDTIVTNAQLETRLDTTDAWIVERSGIKERRFGGTVSEMSIRSGQAALDRAGIVGADVDLLVLATSTPEMTMPATSALVHGALGLSGGAFDLNAACAGFVYALVMAHGAIATGARRVLVVGADCCSRITDQDDRSTAVLFADGAGAVVVAADGGENTLLGTDMGVDATAYGLLTVEHGGYFKMEGREVFRRAVRMTVESATAALERAKLTPRDVNVFVPHQANLRIIEAVAERLGIPMDRVPIVLDRLGNTSSASIPLALAEAADQGRIHPGDNVLFSGFGAGMTCASAVVRWAPGDAR